MQNVESILEQIQKYAENCERTARVYSENGYSSKADKYMFGAHCLKEAMEIIRKEQE